MRAVKRAPAIVVLGVALVLAGAGCGAPKSARVRRSASSGSHGILLLGYGHGSAWILRWRLGSPPKPLTKGDYGVSGGGEFFSGMSDGSWSPDGSSIAYEADSPGGLAPPTPSVLVMWANGKHIEPLTSDPSSEDGDGPPSWSPDGHQIVYERHFTNYSGSFRQDFAIVDIPSGHKRILPAGRLATSDPVWGKAGIAYASKSGIRLLDPATGRSRLVTGDIVSGTTLAWSPDGVLAVLEPTQIVLLATSGQVLGTLRLPVEGRACHTVFRPNGTTTTCSGGLCDIAWSPDGNQILASTWTTQNPTLWVGTLSSKRWHRLAPVPNWKEAVAAPPRKPIWRSYKYNCPVSWR